MQLSVQKNKLDKVSKTKTIRIKIVIVKCNCKFSIQNQIFKLKKKGNVHINPIKIHLVKFENCFPIEGKGQGQGYQWK